MELTSGLVRRLVPLVRKAENCQSGAEAAQCNSRLALVRLSNTAIKIVGSHTPTSLLSSRCPVAAHTRATSWPVAPSVKPRNVCPGTLKANVVQLYPGPKLWLLSATLAYVSCSRDNQT